MAKQSPNPVNVLVNAVLNAERSLPQFPEQVNQPHIEVNNAVVWICLWISGCAGAIAVVNAIPGEKQRNPLRLLIVADEIEDNEIVLPGCLPKSPAQLLQKDNR